MAPDQLDAAARTRALARMAQETFDVVVIGGGVTGVGCALDAATRGLSVALIEMRDLGAGTSSRSSKLIHGGLRYLEQLNVALVWEALRERSRLLDRLAPHLVRPVPFLYPLTHRGWERLYAGAGVALYDLMASTGHNPLPRHRHLTRRGVQRACPALRRDAMVGGIQYWDAQVDDARFVVALARTAARYGAVMATSARVTGLVRENERVVGARFVDLESGQETAVRSRQIINATGVWTDDIQDMVGRGRIHVRASKGIHLVVPRDRVQSDTGIILRTTTSVLFVIPWGRHWLIGTTDTDWDLDKSHPAASLTDIDYLLREANSVLNTPLTRDDIEGVYAGLRPLLHGESEATSTLSREHAVSSPVPGLISVAGGKYTTYRVMARDAVDAAARSLEKLVPPSCTGRVAVCGADGFGPLWNRRHLLAADSGLHVARIERLLGRYGSTITDILELVADRPELGQPLEGGEDYLAAEIVYAASHEGALHLDDVLTRRTRLSIETFDRGVRAARPAAHLMAEVLGWDDTVIKREIEHYDTRVEAERDSQTKADDRTADAARLGAPDVRLAGRSA